MKKYLAEMVGTMTLVLMGCGSAVFNGGCGTTAQVLTVAMAFGLSVVAINPMNIHFGLSWNFFN